MYAYFVLKACARESTLQKAVRLYTYVYFVLKACARESLYTLKKQSGCICVYTSFQKRVLTGNVFLKKQSGCTCMKYTSFLKRVLTLQKSSQAIHVCILRS